MQEIRKPPNRHSNTLCYFHFTGTCKNGNTCRFRHTSPYNLKLLRRIKDKISVLDLAVSQASDEVIKNKIPRVSTSDIHNAMKSLNKYYKDYELDYEQRYKPGAGISSKDPNYSHSKRVRSRSRSITRSTKSTSSERLDYAKQERGKSARSSKHSRDYKREVSFLDFLDEKETTDELMDTPSFKIQESEPDSSSIATLNIETWQVSEFELDANYIMLDIPYTSSINSSAQSTRYINPHIETLEMIQAPKERSSSCIIDPRIKTKLQFLGYDCITNEPRSFSKVDKFNIVIDLDRTLIDSILKSELKIPIKNYSFRIEEIQWPFKGVIYEYIVAIRPGIDEFLQKLSSFSTLWLYTSAIVEYAECVLKIIDPEGKYFSNRILGSACLAETKAPKSLSRLIEKFPELDKSVCCILDDNIGVWVEDQDKLIPTMAFSPFKTYGKSKFTYHPKLASYKFEDLRERFLDKKGTELNSLVDVVMRTYREFVLNDCKITAAYAYEVVRRQTLQGMRVSFESYIARLDGKLYTSLKLNTYVYIAELLGATITEENSKQVVEKAVTQQEISSDALLNSYFKLCTI